MSAISSWLLSITGVILLSVLAEFVLPEGQINKYTKVIFSFVILLSIIMPLPKLFGKDFQLKNFFGNSQTLQEDYLYQLNIDKLTALNSDISNDVKKQGMQDVVISINANVLCEELEIYSVHVDLRYIKFDKNFENPSKTKAKECIKKTLDNYALLKDVEVKFDE